MRTEPAARRLTTRPGDGEPTWSPDGRRIAYRSSSATSFDLWVVPSTGGTRRPLLRTPSANELDPDWSPDGRRIAMQSSRGGQIQIWVLSLFRRTRPEGDTRRSELLSGLGLRRTAYRLRDRRPDRGRRHRRPPPAHPAQRLAEERRRPGLVPGQPPDRLPAGRAGAHDARSGRRRSPLRDARLLGHERRARLVAPEPAPPRRCRNGDVAGSRRRPDRACTRLGSVSRPGRADHRATAARSGRGHGRPAVDRNGGGPRRPEAVCRSGDLRARR